MPQITVRFVNSDDFVGKAIDWVTFSLWDHTEIQTADGGYIGAHAGSGVQERPANYCTPSRERRYTLDVTQEQYDKIFAFAKSKVGTPYNYRDIVGLFIHHDITSQHREICSMFVFECFLAAGIQLLNVLPKYSNLVTPETLHLSPHWIGKCTYKFPAEE
jgi:uncharacterized protein YycO